MLHKIVRTFLCLSAPLISLYAAPSWYEQKLEGWYYFQDQEASEELNAQVTLEDAEEILASEQKNLRQLLSMAILAPTSENVESYVREQKRWIQQSAHFADIWGKILLETPSLGDFLLNPTTNYGLLAKRELDLAQTAKRLQGLAKDHFLLFFFRGRDPLSLKALEVAKLFASLHGWKVKAVSLDGQGVGNNMEFDLDRGLSTTIGVDATPSFFVINPFKNVVFPVGAGLISVSDLEQNIEIQLKTESTDE
jgi:conjugal transfer pilus assembly protein TraF